MMRKVKLLILACLLVFIIFSHRAYLTKAASRWFSRGPAAGSQARYLSRGQISPLSGDEQMERALAVAGAKAGELGIETTSMTVTIDNAEWNKHTVNDPEFWFKHKDLWDMLLGKNFLPVHYSGNDGAGLWVFVDTKFYTVITYLLETKELQ